MATGNWKRTGVVLLAIGLAPGCKTISEKGLLSSWSDRRIEVPGNAQASKPTHFGSTVSVSQSHSDYATDSRLAKKLNESSLTHQKVGTADRFRHAATSVKDALTIDPKTVKASDPINLSASPGRIQPSLYLSAALLYEQQGRLGEAIHQYERLLALEPNNRSALVALGRLNHRRGDLQKSIEIYGQAAGHYPNDPVILNDFALCLARANRTDEAMTVLNSAIRMRPDSLLYRNNLAAVLVEANRIDEAVEILRQAHGATVAHYNVAYMLKQKGDTHAATSHFTKALHADPSFEPARQMLDQLTPQIGTRPIRRESVRPDGNQTGMTPPQIPPQQPPTIHRPELELDQPQARLLPRTNLPVPTRVQTLALPTPVPVEISQQPIAERPVPPQLVPFVLSPIMGPEPSSIAPLGVSQEEQDVVQVAYSEVDLVGSTSEEETATELPSTSAAPPESAMEPTEALIRLPFSRPVEPDEANLVPPSPDGVQSILAPGFIPVAD